MAKRPPPVSSVPPNEPADSLQTENTRLRQQQVEAVAQQAADERYQRRQARFWAVFENSPMGQKIIGPDLVIRQANQALATLLGLQGPEQVVGRKIMAFAHPDFVQDWERLQQELWTHQKAFFVLETCLVRVDKSAFWCRVTSVLFPDEGGELGYTTLEDITEVQRLQAENLRLRLTQQQALFETVQATEEAERRRIAEALHNGIGQQLYATKLRLDQWQAPALHPDPALAAAHADANRLLSEAIRQTRALSHELVPMILEDFGLAAALQDIGRKLSTPHLQLRGRVTLDAAAPPPALQLALYRMAQELALNIVRHASGATRARIELETEPGWARLRAEDNGPGFAPGLTPGLGLRSIRVRVALLGGQFETGAVPTGGAYVRIQIPVPISETL